jgi:iron complex outermembrane receptor protein/outer membrane receptor for ferric coprogen and ferric-rhodotorulic acid
MSSIANAGLNPVALAALLLACGVNTPLLAQVSTQAPAGALPEIKVTDSATPSSLYTVPAVSIGKTEQSLKDTPQSISVITRQRLDDQNITKVEDALKQTTGVTVERFDGAGNYNTIRSRGFEIGAIQLDGVPISQGSNYSTALDTAIYDRIEVLRGPAGLLQGAGEPGGAINLVRKRALGTLGLGANASVGSFGLRRADVDVTGALNAAGTLRARVVGVKEDRNSYVDTLFNNRETAYGTLEFDFTPATTLSVGYTRQKVRAAVDQGLPSLANGQLLDLPVSSFAGLRANRQDLDTEDAFAELEHRLHNGGLIKFSARDVTRTSFYRAARANSAVAANGNYTMQTVDFLQKNTDRNYDLFLTSPVKIGETTHRVLLGMSRNSGDNFGGNFANGPNFAANIYQPNYDLAYPVINLPGYTSVTTRSEDALYGQFQLNATERLKLLAGGRASWADIEVKRASDGVTTSTSNPGRQFTPSVAAIYALDASISAYTSYAETFVLQTALNAAGGLLPPRTGSQIEAGLKGEFFNKRLNAHAAIFRILDKNRAITDPAVPTASIAGGEVRSQGLETEISGQVAPGWDLTAGYAYTETLYLKAPAAQAGTVFSPVTPKHSINLSTRYALRSPGLTGWSVGGGVTWRSAFSAQSGAIKLVSGDYALFNAQVAYQVNDKVSVSLSADNLLDEKYYEKVSGVSRQNFYGEPRRVVLALKARY